MFPYHVLIKSILRKILFDTPGVIEGITVGSYINILIDITQWIVDPLDERFEIFNFYSIFSGTNDPKPFF